MIKIYEFLYDVNDVSRIYDVSHWCITHISQHNTVHRVHTVNLKNFKTLTLSSLFPSPWRVTFCSRLPSSKFFQNKKVEVPNPSSNK